MMPGKEEAGRPKVVAGKEEADRPPKMVSSKKKAVLPIGTVAAWKSLRDHGPVPVDLSSLSSSQVTPSKTTVIII